MLLQDANHSPSESAERLFHCIWWEVKVTNYNKKQVQKSNMSTEYNRKYGYSVHAQFIQLKRPNLTQPYSFNKKSVTE